MGDGWPSSRPYVIASVANWLAFLAAIFLLSWATAGDRLPVGALWAIAIVLAGSVAGQFYAAYRLIARQDEYIRAITVKRMIAATGLTITAAVFWGTAEQFLGVRNLPMWLVYPFFWGAFGMVTPLIRDTRP
ncbi:hypothetical protein [Allosphingosinicella sp.]|jgi:hypothetical protein|uniref:hypothetical protein n=1 Tax=Allosphingosinicella sp. TaxID=2823234 RepID=UPI002F204129